MKRLLGSSLALAVVAATLTLLPGAAAQAAPTSATFSASARGDAARVTTSLAGISLLGLGVGTGNATAAASGSRATTANLDADVAGIGVATTFTQQSAPPTAADPVTGTLGTFDLGAVSVGALSGSSRAVFPTGGRCLADGTLSRASTTAASLRVGTLLSTTALTTTSTTALVPGTGTLNRGLRSTSTAGDATATALGVSIGVVGSPTLTTDANGATTFTPGTVTVNGTALTPGTSRTVTVGLGEAVKVTAASNSTVTRTASGGSVDVVSVEVTTALASATVALNPLRTSATAPAGGLDCTPDAPTITTPANGSTTSNARPPVSGTGTPGATVTLRDGSNVLSSSIAVGSDGRWTYTPTTDLNDGAHTFTATQAVAGVASSAVSTTVTIDATAPAAPVITSPADGARVAAGALTVRGTGEAGASLTVATDGAASQPVTVAQDGTWTATIGPLGDGTHRLVATQRDAAGNASAASSAVTVSVDATAPDAPVLVSPADGAILATTTPVVSGTGEPGATVSVREGSSVLCTARVAANGSWSCTVSSALAQGAHVLGATQADDAGNVSAAATTHRIVVDTQAPSAPAITSPADGSAQRTGDVVVRGTAEPGATVRLSLDGGLVRVLTADTDGTWTTDVSGLTDGGHTFTATQTDRAGNGSPASAGVRITVDTTAPDRPVISTPADGSLLAVGTVPVTGTGEPGATLTLSVDGQAARTVTVGSDGGWTTTVGLGDGTHRLVATQADAAGNVSTATPVTTVRVDTTAPPAPVVTSPADGSATDDATPTVRGTGEPGAIVTVLVDGQPACTATVGSDGTWTCDVSPALADGSHVVTARQSDEAGNGSPTSDPVRLTVDTSAPAAPSISTPADGTRTSDRTPAVSGTGEAGATVQVRVGSTVLCTATVTTGGTWTCTPTTELPDGEHELVAVQTDRAGNTSAASSTVTITVDGTLPPAPAITAPADGSSTRDATPTVSGTGQDGADVVVTSGGATLCTTTVRGDGTWSCDSATLADGPHEITATQTTTAGTSSPAAAVTVTVDTRAPAVPVITAPADGTVQRSDAVEITGTAEPRASVSLSLDGTVVRTVTADAQGAWATDLSGIAEGDHVLRATQADAAGNVSDPSAEVGFGVDTVAPDAPTIVDPDSSALVADPTPTLSGRGEPGATVVVREGTDEVCRATVQPDGSWECTVSPALDDGTHVLVATQTDDAGNESPASDALELTVDTTAPSAPVIADPADQDRTADATPTIAGTGVAGTTVTVSDQDGAVCSTTVRQDGTWECTSTRTLADGTHRLTATQSDEAGNASAPSSVKRLVVDTTAPSAPVVTDPADGSTSTTSTVRVSGTGEPGAELVLRVDGTDRPAVRVADDGRWSVELTGLADGDHTVSATQSDAVGNGSARSGSVTFAVDTRDVTAPDAPQVLRPVDGTVTDDATPEVTGTGEPGATVTVREGDTVLCEAEVDAQGDWSCTVAPALADGTHVLRATQTDEAGNESTASTAVRVSVDTTAPAAPVLTAPADGAATRTRAVPVSGTGEPGARVTVSVDGQEACTALVAANGTWTCTTPALPDGTHRISAVQRDDAGNVSAASEVRTILVDTAAPARPVVTAPADGTRTADPRPAVSGTGEPGATLVVRTGTRTLCTTTVTAGGAWTCTSARLDDGTYPLVATQTDRAGNESSASTTVTVTTDTTAPAAPRIVTPATGYVTGYREVVVTGSGEPGARLVVSVDGTAQAPVTVDARGSWTTTLRGLADGDHRVTAVQTDAVGNRSAASTVTTVTVNTRVPGQPAITSPRSGTSTLDTRPQISGNGQPGARVTVQDQSGMLCETDVVRAGTWTCTPGRSLANGTHDLVAKQSTARGGSPTSPMVEVKVVPPATPAVTAPGSTVLTRSASTPVTISGTGTPGGRLTVRTSSGAVVGVTTVASNGRWTLRSGALRPGSYRVSATQVVQGRTSAASAGRTFRVVSLQVRIIKGVDPTRATRPKIRGTGTPGAKVTVRTTKGKVLGKATVRSNGKWSMKSKPIKKGRYSIRATQTYSGQTTTSNLVTFRAKPRS